MAASGSTSVAVTNYDTLKFSWSTSSQSIENNTSTVSWTMQLVAGSAGYISSSAAKSWSVTVDGTTYSGTNYIGISNNSTKTLASGTTIISHGTDGTKAFSYSFSQQFSITFSGASIGTISGSGSGTLDTIPRASTLTVSDGVLGTAQTLTINRNSSSFTHTITYTCWGAAGATIVTKTSSTSISFTPPTSLAAQNSSGTYVSIEFVLTTYNGSTEVGTSSKAIRCDIPESIKPSCSVSVSDAMGYSGTYGGFIQNVSKFKVTVTGTTAGGSPIASYSTTANGATYTDAIFTTGVCKTSGTSTISAKVTDKRGRSGTSSANVTVLAYSAPIISALKVNRCNSDGTTNDRGEYAKVTFSAAVTSLSSKNTAAYVLKYKKSLETSYTSVTLSSYANNYAVSDGTYIFAADSGSSYNIAITVTDKFNSSDLTTSVSTGFTTMHWPLSRKGMGIGKICEKDFLLDVEWTLAALGGVETQRPTTADRPTLGTGGIYTFKATSSMTTSKPPWDAHILGFEWDNTNGYDSQMAIKNSSAGLATRHMSGGTWGSWVQYFSTANASSYVSASGGSATNGYIKFPSSKIMICWQLKTISNVTITSAWGVCYESSSEYSFDNFAATFSSVPACARMAYGSSGVGLWFEGGTTATTTSNPGTFYLVRPNSYSTKFTAYCVAIAVGQYS